MVSKTSCLLLGLALLAALSPGQARPISAELGRTGRSLLDIRVEANGDFTTWSPSIVALDTQDASSQCAFQGGGITDGAPVQGPLYVVVPKGKTATVNFGLGDTESLNLQTLPPIVLQGITIGRDYQKGLISATYTAAQEFGSGNAVTLTAELHLHTGDYQADLCQMTVIFVVGDAPTPPSPPPPATPTPTTPVYPKAPCYCSPAANGESACFDFNQASSDINCAPPSTYKCQVATAAAGQYSIQQGGPIFLCKV